MVTFTVDPKKHPDLNQMDKIKQIEKYIVKVCAPLAGRAYFAREHDNSNVHWHVIIHRNTRLPYEKFGHYKRVYGNVDISRSHQLDDQNSINYLGKESEIQIIKGQKLKNKIV